jgi:hypothetical protein
VRQVRGSDPDSTDTVWDVSCLWVELPQYLDLTGMVNVVHRDPHDVPNRGLMTALHGPHQIDWLKTLNGTAQFLVCPREQFKIAAPKFRCLTLR